MPRPGIRIGIAAVAVGCALLGVVPAIVESSDSPATHAAGGTGSYRVRPGDYLYRIARATGTDLTTLLSLNRLTLNSVILPGQLLRTNAPTGGSNPATAPEWSGATYTVRPGDYLYRIARATGTDLTTLLSLNGLTLTSVILPGQVLRTNAPTGGSDPATAPEWSGATYTVRSGDYLYRIARASGTGLSALLSLNGLTLDSVIQPGQVLKIAGPGPAPSGATYTVVSGDCWSCIARKVGVPMRALLATNGASTTTMIHPGQVIKLPEGAVPPGGSTPAGPETSPSVADPWLRTRLRSVVGANRVDLAESLGGRPLVIVWDSSIPSGTEAVTDPSTTIRVHPRLRDRPAKLDNVLAHEFGHVMILLALDSTPLDDPGVCHEKVADEIATRIRGDLVREHRTAECTWDQARSIADQIVALGF